MSNSTYRIIGSVSGLAIVIAAFLPWHGEIQRVNTSLGLTVYSTDELLGFDFTTILAGVLYLLFLALAHKASLWKTLGTIAAGACLLLSAYNYWRFFRTDVLIGLKLTLIASLFAVVAILMIKTKPDSTPA